MKVDFAKWFTEGNLRKRFPAALRFRGPVLALAITALLFTLVLAWLGWKLPLDRALAPLPDPTLVLLDRYNIPFARRGAYKEAPVDAKLLPAHVVQAVLAIEDRRFYQHGAIDPWGILRALAHNARAGQVEQGGSTITQQLAKTSFLSPERTLRRKVQESLIAAWLELRLDKQEILSRYLSSIYFGEGVYGLRAAARHYFDVAPEQLNLPQAAMLAGMIKAPSTLAPSHDPAAAQARAKVVLDAMVEMGAITKEQALASPPATITGSRAELPVGSYFADWVSPLAKDAFYAAYGEVPVHTTLDMRLQQYAEQALKHGLGGDGDSLHATQGALIAMRANGEVVAMVGGRDYAQSSFNRAIQAKRQPGSAFKLFVYRAALHAGATPDTMVEDEPITIGHWSPSNYGDEYRGRITLREAFAHSSNSAAVRLAQQVGAPAIIRSARELGISTPLGSDSSLALGSYETTLMELTAAYAALAAGSAPVIPYGLADRPPHMARTRLDPNEQRMLLDLLWSVVEQGTGRAARLGVPTFGKTGTTQDYRDALFIGMAGDLITGV
ncbi:MAG TPA: transglycosylase domain-containing protein, partial [Xanthomonadaceae bacterium]|nr:transglycosylase domain-containing protein [Xanthomonadaceae bacterium]